MLILPFLSCVVCEVLILLAQDKALCAYSHTSPQVPSKEPIMRMPRQWSDN